MSALAQLRAVLCGAGAYDCMEADVSGLLQVGDLSVDVDRCEVQREGAFVALTESEFRILEDTAGPRPSAQATRILNAVTTDYDYLPRKPRMYSRRTSAASGESWNPRRVFRATWFHSARGRVPARRWEKRSRRTEYGVTA